MADNTQKQMTRERAALREIAERRAKDLESHKDCPLVDGEDIGDETCDLALQYHFACAYLDAIAPLLVKCGECGGKGHIADPWPESKTGWDCSACHGKGYVERADLAEIRKQFKDAPHAGDCSSTVCVCRCHGCMAGYCGNHRDDTPHTYMACDCWKSTFGLDALLELIAAQAREIAELKEKANG